MASKVVTPAATVTSQMGNTSLNPVQTVSSTGIRVVHVTLTFNGISFDPAVLQAGLDATYTTVASKKTYQDRGCYDFDIS